MQRPEGGHTNDVSGRASCVLSARVTYERLTRPDAATTRTSRYLVGPPGASSVRVTACAAVLCHAPLVPSPKNGVVQTRSPRSGSPKSPSSLDAPRTCVQRRLTFTHLSPCLSHWPVGPETNHETTSPCSIPFVGLLVWFLRTACSACWRRGLLSAPSNARLLPIYAPPKSKLLAKFG